MFFAFFVLKLREGGSGWEWVGVDGSGWEWMGVGGSANR